METKEKIVASFFTLLDGEPFATINVRQLMAQAQLSRTLFYQYFDSKQDLALYALEKLVAQIARHVTPTRVSSQDIRVYKQQTLRTLNEILTQKNRFELLMQVQGSQFNLLNEFQKQLKEQILSQLAPQYPAVDRTQIDYYAALFASSLLTTLQWFFEHADFSLAKLVDFIADGIFHGLFSVITSE